MLTHSTLTSDAGHGYGSSREMLEWGMMVTYVKPDAFMGRRATRLTFSTVGWGIP